MTWNVNGQMTSQSWSPSYGTFFSIPAGGLQYVYSATQNNGQITRVVDTISGEAISYQYDALKRLTSANSVPNSGSNPPAWTQTYQYDGFGNLTAKVLNGTTTSIAVNAATNRLSNSGYDANGNMTTGVGGTFAYDEANRIASATEVSGGTEYYGYAPDNKRIYRLKTNGQEEWTFYGAQGEKLGVYSLSGGTASRFGLYANGPNSSLRFNVWFAGRLIYQDQHPMIQDRLGTTRSNGWTGARYYPYGDELTSMPNDENKFATYFRDGFTGLDYADQRYYASTYGRFTTADPFSGSAAGRDPGTWNRYSYSSGDPVNLNDPMGTCQHTTYSSDGNGNFTVTCIDFDLGGGGGGAPTPSPGPVREPPAGWDALSGDCQSALRVAMKAKNDNSGIPIWLAAINRVEADKKLLQSAAADAGIDWTLLLAPVSSRST
jgi:RHS repeat-associated protein